MSPSEMPSVYPSYEDITVSVSMQVIQSIKNCSLDIPISNQDDENLLTFQQSVAQSLGYEIQASDVFILDIIDSDVEEYGHSSALRFKRAIRGSKNILTMSRQTMLITYQVLCTSNLFTSSESAYTILSGALTTR